ncbi:histidine triad nucleotide-binding protein [bacterium]|nr:histidine triad nucleotide-binding protein [bacterium]
MEKECIFCKIIRGEVSSEKILEDEDFIVIKDINPKADVHLLIIPKEHITSLREFNSEKADMLGKMLLVSKELAKKFDQAKDGYKIAINVGKGGGQIIDHFHIHFLAGNLTGLP